MSAHQTLAAVTATLAHLLSDAVGDAVDEARVTHVRPSDVEAGLPIVNLFLYGVSRNAALANQAAPTRGPSGEVLQRPVLALDLSYLFTFHGDEETLVPQRLLGAVATTLHAHPVLGHHVVQQALDALALTEGKEFLEGCDLARQAPTIRITPQSLDLEALSKLWSVFIQTPYALTLGYQVSVVLLEADVPEASTLPVTSRQFTVGPRRAPRLRRVEALSGEITADATLVLRGAHLSGEGVRVHLDDDEGAPPSRAAADRLELPLAGRALAAGAHSVHVSHTVTTDAGRTLVGSTSNALPFVLRPTVTATATADALTLTVDPPVQPGQRVQAVLSPVGGGAGRVLDAPPVPAPTTELELDLVDVPPGTWLVRVRVDGASSPLAHDGDAFTGPTVTVPA